jgi:hypothetical protein
MALGRSALRITINATAIIPYTTSLVAAERTAFHRKSPRAANANSTSE